MNERLPGKQVRRKFFRNVRVRLECGHDGLIESSNLRLTRDRVFSLISNSLRLGLVHCKRCNGPGHPKRFLRTERGVELK